MLISRSRLADAFRIGEGYGLGKSELAMTATMLFLLDWNIRVKQIGYYLPAHIIEDMDEQEDIKEVFRFNLPESLIDRFDHISLLAKAKGMEYGLSLFIAKAEENCLIENVEEPSKNIQVSAKISKSVYNLFLQRCGIYGLRKSSAMIFSIIFFLTDRNTQHLSRDYLIPAWIDQEEALESRMLRGYIPQALNNMLQRLSHAAELSFSELINYAVNMFVHNEFVESDYQQFLDSYNQKGISAETIDLKIQGCWKGLSRSERLNQEDFDSPKMF